MSMAVRGESNTEYCETGKAAPEGALPLPLLRSAVAGILMGLANLVPGVSGGTMIVVMGLYDEFIGGVADVCRLKFTRRNVTFLVIVGGAAGVAIATLAGTLSRTVTLYPSAMFALFIGMTLGGAPILVKMLGRPRTPAGIGLLLGFAVMMAVALTREEPPDQEAIRAAVARGEFVIRPHYGRDATAGVLGMSAMVLPGISGAYMLLILGRYETILAAVSMTKSYVLSAGGEGDPAVFLRVLIPTAVGAVASLVFFSNLLKWMLHHRREFTVALLLGILAGSVIGIWPFDKASTAGEYLVGTVLAIAGFVATFALSRLGK